MKDMEDKEKLQINNYKLQIVDLYKLFNTRIKNVDLKTWVKRLGFYLKIWWMMSKNAFMMYFNQKSILAIFLAGKIFRFTFFIIFLYFLVTGSKGLAGYNTDQIIFFFLSFNVIDIISQFLFREVYRFRTLVVSGDLDLILVKPINPLFRILFGGADVIDLITIPPVVAATIYMGAKLGPSAV